MHLSYWEFWGKASTSGPQILNCGRVLGFMEFPNHGEPMVKKMENAMEIVVI